MMKEPQLELLANQYSWWHLKFFHLGMNTMPPGGDLSSVHEFGILLFVCCLMRNRILLEIQFSEFVKDARVLSITMFYTH